ncbi:hypothetical protein ACFXPT_11655 [Streptomyces goshikiensis]|uniref:hypothetical protein n=1 Tax=Streptomyces goshikiensis TaxID=1942 RepID=UPI003676F78D
MGNAKDIAVASAFFLLVVGGLGAAAVVADSKGIGAAPAPSPSPTYGGPAWNAYEAGRIFGLANQTATMPESARAPKPTSTRMYDAVAADHADAAWWCRHNLPYNLRSTHGAYLEDLMAGCIDGILPWADMPSSKYLVTPSPTTR